MALQTSGPISLRDVNIELGLSAGATISLGGSNIRGLAGVSSGPISLANLRGKSAGKEGVITYTIALNNLNYGTPPESYGFVLSAKMNEFSKFVSRSGELMVGSPPDDNPYRPNNETSPQYGLQIGDYNTTSTNVAYLETRFEGATVGTVGNIGPVPPESQRPAREIEVTSNGVTITFEYTVRDAVDGQLYGYTQKAGNSQSDIDSLKSYWSGRVGSNFTITVKETRSW